MYISFEVWNCLHALGGDYSETIGQELIRFHSSAWVSAQSSWNWLQYCRIIDMNI